MPNTPISRELQIKLMETAKERQEQRARIWTSDPVIKRVLAEPAPGQEPSAYKVVQRHKTG